MQVYTFYCCRPDDAAPSFEARALASDEAAAEHAERMLDEHRSCSHVVVCLDDCEIMTARRGPGGPGKAEREGALAGLRP